MVLEWNIFERFSENGISINTTLKCVLTTHWTSIMNDNLILGKEKVKNIIY